MREIPRVAPSLLVGGHEGAVGLLVALLEIDVLPLLLDKDAGFFDIGVDEAGVAQEDGQLKGEPFFGLLHAEHLAQQGPPEGLGLLLFIAPARPVLDELPRRLSLLAVLHAAPPVVWV